MRALDIGTVEKLATDIVKYQNFQLAAAADRMDYDLTKGSLKRYLCMGRKYIRTKQKSNGAPRDLWVCIDRALASEVQPLTPASGERAYTPGKLTKEHLDGKTVTLYGVRDLDKIQLFSNPHDMKMFFKGTQFCGNHEHIRLGRVIFEDIE